MQVSFWKSIFRRKFFWLTLPKKNFILYMKMESYIITHYICNLLQKESSYLLKCALLIWTYISQGLYHFKIRIYSLLVQLKIPFYKNCNKCGKLGPNPSAKNGPVHFLLGAMLPCSTPFSTSASELSEA